MCHKKCQIFDDFRKFDVFLRMIPGQPGTISRPKKQHFDAKNDDLQIEGYNPRSKAPCFLINMAYTDHLSRSHRALQNTNYYDKMPATYKNYLNVK